jgi:2-keto-4-pentenoate hydratase/2-oxohepta-3-ene-1,7-dioic acid hydratase in catechol pathway
MTRRPTKIVCVGRNYVAHAAEMGNEMPSAPLIFLKPPSALIGPGEPIEVPPGVGRVDFEGEIALVIGVRATAVPEADAWEYVAGVAPLNDVTARDLQRADGQWSRAKGFDTFCAVGDVVSVQESELDSLEVVTTVNGVERQRGHVRDLAFSMPFLVSYVSQIMTLEPGDLLSTGTPEGVGPISPGDEVVVEIPGRARLSNPVIGRAP